MKKYQHIISFSLLLLVVWQIVGFVVFFELEYINIKKSVKYLMKNGVPNEQRIHFQFTEEEVPQLTWIKQNEFKLNGRFYDVLERNQDGENIMFHCIDDRKETQLFKNLSADTYFNMTHGGKDEPLHVWLDFLDEPRISQNEIYQFVLDFQSDPQKRNFFFQYNFFLLFGYPVTINLPPENFLRYFS